MARPALVAALGPLLPAAALLVSSSAAAQGWRWLSPKPQGVAVNAATFPAAAGGRGWLVGAQGTIATTGDQGRTFQQQNSTVDTDLNGVFFLDGLRGWAVGDAGTILQTSDGGAHWQRQPSQSSRKLRAVYFSDALHGLVVGDYRTLLQTADGGQSWSGRGSAVLGLNSVVFTDARHAILCGDSGAILTSADGAASFQAPSTGTSAHLLALAFGDALHGYAVGQGGALLTTADGGASWMLQTVGADDLVAVVALAPQVAFALSSAGALYRTGDGATWQRVDGLTSPSPFTALAAEGSGTTAALDAFTQSGQMLRAPTALPTDAGAPPVFADVNDLLPSTETVRSLGFSSLDRGLIATDVRLYATLDRGSTLAPTGPSGPAYGWTAVSLPSASSAYAVGIRGTCIVSHDPLLRVWTTLAVPTGEDLAAVQFVDDQHGFVAGSGGVAFSTANGGQSWTALQVPVGFNWTALGFRDAQTGVIGGEFGSCAYTSDGQNFQATSAGFATLWGFSLPASGVVIAAGADGQVAHSFNAGRSFFSLASASGSAVRGLWFFDHQNGLLATEGPQATIFVTHDGAQSFAAQFVGSNAFQALTFADAQHGVAGGAGGMLLVTDTGGGAACATDADCLVDAGVPYGSFCAGGACQTCTLDGRCGPSCQPCAAPTATCYGGYCGACLNDLQCPQGYCVLGLCQSSLPDDGGLPGGGTSGSTGGAASTGGSGTSGSSGSGGSGSTAGGATGGARCDGGACSGTSGCATAPGAFDGGATALLLAAALFLPRRRRGR